MTLNEVIARLQDLKQREGLTGEERVLSIERDHHGALVIFNS